MRPRSDHDRRPLPRSRARRREHGLKGDAVAPVQRLAAGLDRPTLVVAGVATLGLIMAVLDTTIVNVALDKLSSDLDASLGTIQWVSTGYLLSLAVVIPLSGWVTERFGSKRPWIASIALFAFGCVLCSMATSAGELIAFRLIQGLGGGMLVPVRIHAGHAERRASPSRPGACGGGRAAPARANLRAHHRRLDR